MRKYSESNIGEFVEQKYGKTFTYTEVSEYNVLDGTRVANVKKTAACVVVEKDEGGNPVFEKWYIKQHVVYNQ